MLSPADIAAVEAALAELLRSVEAVEAQARESRNVLAFLREDETTRRAREVAEARRATFVRFQQQRNALIESPADEHEAAVRLAEGARRIARDGQAANLAAELASSPDRLTFVGNVAKDTARDLTEAAAEAAPSFRLAFRWLPWLVAGLAVAIVAGPLLGRARA